MVESQQIVKQTTSTNPKLGDRLKSALGFGETVRTATTIKESDVGLASTGMTSTGMASTGMATGMASTGMATGVATGMTTANTVTQATAPVVAQATVPVVTQTAARVITDAPIVKTIAHAPVVADVHRASAVTVEERPVITQNITKPVIEIHEKHIQRNVGSAPVTTQVVNPTLVQEIGRENLNFVAPIPTIQTATMEKPAVVTNLRAAPVVAEVHHKPVIERHEQVIIHENVNQARTEVRTQPIVQNIYEKPVIVKSQETIIEKAPAVVAAPVVAAPVVAAPVISAPMVATATTTTLPTTGIVSTGLARRGSASSLSSPEEVGVAHEGLGQKIKRKLHLGHGHGNTGATGLTDPFNFDPDRKIVVQPVATALPATTTTGLASTTTTTTATALPTTGLGATLPEKRGGLFHRH